MKMSSMRKIFLTILCGLLFSGCTNKDKKSNTGVINLKDKTVVWIAEGNNIEVVITFPKAKSSNSILSEQKKGFYLQQVVETESKKYVITAFGKDDDRIDEVTIDGEKVRFIPSQLNYISVKNGMVVYPKDIPNSTLNAVTCEQKSIPEPESDESVILLVIGFVAQLLFTSRMLVQWFASEKAGKSVVPMLFWYLSLAGSTLLLYYSISRQDPVFILGQGFGFIVYVRNIVLIKTHRKKLNNE